MQNVFRKHGKTFEFHIIEPCPAESLTEMEQKHLDKIAPNINILRFSRRSDGYKHTEEVMLKMRSKAKARDKSVYNLSGLMVAPMRKPVAKCDKDGTVLEVYQSITEACRQFDTKKIDHLANCCKGRKKTYKGFKWRFYNEDITNGQG
jgi:hypothetical protein